MAIQVKTELREVSPEERAVFNDEFHKHIFEMVSSSDNNEKIGGILAICKYSTIIKITEQFIPPFFQANHFPCKLCFISIL